MHDTHPFRILFSCLIILPTCGSGQSVLRWKDAVASSQVALPSSGAAAAGINPAELADGHLAAAAYGYSGAFTGGKGAGFLQLAAGAPQDLWQWPVGVAAGFGYAGSDGVDGWTAVHRESEYSPGMAVRYPANPRSRWSMAAGLRLSFAEYNAFDAVRSNSVGITVGTALAGDTRAGRIGFGFTYHDLRSHRVRLPEALGWYRIPGWREYALSWSSPGKRISLGAGMYDREDQSSGEGPDWKGETGLSGWEAEIRPSAWFGLKAERTMLTGMSNLGLVVYLPPGIAFCDARTEINIGHATRGASSIPAPYRYFLLLDKERNEGSGFLLGISFSAGIAGKTGNARSTGMAGTAGN